MDKKIAVVTGGGGILCRAICLELAKTMKVAVLDLNLKSAEDTARQVELAGGEAKAFKANVLERESLENVKREINKAFGSVDILVNGAGGNSPLATTDKEYYFDGDINNNEIKSFFNLDKAGIEFVFDLNIMGTILPSQVFIADMLGKSGCSVLNISSMNAFTPLTKIPAYSAAKAGISNFTKWLAVHFASQGIRVNAIAPGFFVTAQNRSLLFDESGKPTSRTAKILSATPMNRFGNDTEILGAVQFLLDEKVSSFITGVVLPIDGGFSSYSGV